MTEPDAPRPDRPRDGRPSEPAARLQRSDTAVGRLLGRHVRLVPVALVPLDLLHEIVLTTGAGTTWRTRGLLVDRERFRSLVSGELSFALVEPGAGTVLGHVGIHGFDPLSGTGELTAFVDPRAPIGPIAAAEGVDLFLQYAFAHAGLRKITIEMPSRSADQMARTLRSRPGFTHEGTRLQHVRLGADLVDIDVYAVWAATFAPAPRVPAQGTGAPSFADLVHLVASCAPDPTVAPTISGGHRLVEDLGYDSLSLLDLVDRIEDRLAPHGPILLSGFDDLTVQRLLHATEEAWCRGDLVEARSSHPDGP